MPFITQELIKKKSEHHDGLLSDLQELSLHQQNLEKIDVLGSVCRKLEILYLQNNLIGRMENLNRLKHLKYLNMALNNVTKIENVGGCENLERLDLTVNFVPLENLEDSITELADLVHFEELYLTGNPCTDWPLYRSFVISQQPHQKRLDGKDVTVLERQEASRDKKEMMAKQRMECARIRDMKRQRELFGEEEPKSNAFTPQMRVEMYQEELEAQQRKDAENKKPSQFAPAPDLVKAAYDKLNARELPREDGFLPAQRNTGRYEFHLEENKQSFILSVQVPRFLDTSAMIVDVHPRWVQCLVKGKNLLVHIDEEVSVEGSVVQRVASTGELVLTLPKLKGYNKGKASTVDNDDGDILDNHTSSSTKKQGNDQKLLRNTGDIDDNSGMVKSHEKVSKKLEQERLQAELAVQKEKMAQQEAREMERTRTKAQKAKQDAMELDRLKNETDLDQDDLPDLA